MTYDHDAAMKRPSVGIAKVGASKWFWVWWPTHREQYDGEDPHRYGYADTHEKAIKECGGDQAFIPGWRPERGFCPNAYLARAWRSIFAARRRKPNTTVSDAHVEEYLYHHESGMYEMGGSYRRTCKHRITKKTRKKIFCIADCNGHGPDTTGGVFRVGQMALDRATLERGEELWVGHGPFRGAMCGVFFTTDSRPGWEDGADDMDVPECFAALGLKPPATRKQITRQYRRLSKKVHPDHQGGDGEPFRKLYEAYEAALALAESELAEA
jgi:DnaJ domain